MVQYPVMARRQLERTDLFSMTANAKNLAATTQRKFGQVTAPVSSIASSAAAHISSAFPIQAYLNARYLYPSPLSAAPIPTDQATAALIIPVPQRRSMFGYGDRPRPHPLPIFHLPTSPQYRARWISNPPPRPTTAPAPAQGTTPAPPPPTAASPSVPEAFNHGDVLMADDTAPAPLPSATEAQAPPPPAAQRPRTPASATPPAKASFGSVHTPRILSSPAPVPPAQYIPPSPAPESPAGAPAPRDRARRSPAKYNLIPFQKGGLPWFYIGAKEYDLRSFRRCFSVRGLPDDPAEIDRMGGCTAEVWPLDSLAEVATAVATLDLNFSDHQRFLAQKKLLFLARLSVEPKYRSRSLATALLVSVLQWAKQTGLTGSAFIPSVHQINGWRGLMEHLRKVSWKLFYNRFCYGRYGERLLLQVPSETDFWVAVKGTQPLAEKRTPNQWGPANWRGLSK